MVIITPEKNLEKIKNIYKKLELDYVMVLDLKKANKCLQIIQGLKISTIAIIIFANNDIFWLHTYLTYIFASFEDPKVGAADRYTSLYRDSKLNIWEFFDTAYFKCWNFKIATISHMDGRIAGFSGQTGAFRTSII